MKRGTIINAVGTMLLSGVFVWSAAVVLSRHSPVQSREKVQIRFGHWSLEAGMREAFEQVAADYMKLHPEVDVRQVPVPGRVYTTWLQTGYVGGGLPDLVVLSNPADEVLSTYYAPMTAEVLKPNPYNVGTPLEGVPWRDTFVDGLIGSYGLGTLQDYYSIPSAILTSRIYYNRSLWREFLGDEKPPRSYAEFTEICRRIEAHARETGRKVIPLAGSSFTANILLNELMRSQTQKRALELDRLHVLEVARNVPAISFLSGYASLDDPAVRDGLSLMRDAGNLMQPGFMQLDRDEAILYFAQGRAVMIPTGAWDYGSIAEQSAFEIGVFEMPLPDAATPRFGNNVLGPAAEVGRELALNFLLSAQSKHPEVAVDFLKFMTSQRENQVFANISKWPPGIVGVEPAPETREFAPIKEGFTPGFRIADLIFGQGDLYLLHAQNIHKLFGGAGSVEKFVEGMRPQFAAAVRADVLRQAKLQRSSAQRMDSVVGALGVRQAGGEAAAMEKFSGALQAQNAQESLGEWLRDAVREGEETPP